MLNKSTLPVLLFCVVVFVLIALFQGSSKSINHSERTTDDDQYQWKTKNCQTGMQIFAGLCPCLNDIEVNQPTSEIEQAFTVCVFTCFNDIDNTSLTPEDYKEYTEYEGGEDEEDEEAEEGEEGEEPNEEQSTVKKGERVATANTNRLHGEKNTKNIDKKPIADTPTNAKAGQKKIKQAI